MVTTMKILKWTVWALFALLLFGCQEQPSPPTAQQKEQDRAAISAPTKELPQETVVFTPEEVEYLAQHPLRSYFEPEAAGVLVLLKVKPTHCDEPRKKALCDKKARLGQATAIRAGLELTTDDLTHPTYLKKVKQLLQIADIRRANDFSKTNEAEKEEIKRFWSGKHDG